MSVHVEYMRGNAGLKTTQNYLANIKIRTRWLSQ